MHQDSSVTVPLDHIKSGGNSVLSRRKERIGRNQNFLERNDWNFEEGSSEIFVSPSLQKKFYYYNTLKNQVQKSCKNKMESCLIDIYCLTAELAGNFPGFRERLSFTKIIEGD